MAEARKATKEGKRYFSWAVRQYTLGRAYAELRKETLDENFVRLVTALTPESDYVYYDQIFGNYGTHYISEADIGARVESYMQIGRCYHASEGTSSIESCQKAGLEGEVSTVNGGVGM